MIQGVTIRCARITRTTNASRIAPASTRGIVSERSATASKRHAGKARGRDSLAKPDLSSSVGDVAQYGIVHVEADLACRGCDVMKHGVLHGGSARTLLERDDVEIRNSVEVVLLPRVVGGGGAHSGPEGRVRHQPLEGRDQRLHLQLVDRNLDGDDIRKLREPTDVAH